MYSCSSRGGDELRREKVRHQFGHKRLAEANGRSSSWRGFVDRAAAAEVVGSSSRWPHTVLSDHVSTSYVGICPTNAGCGMDAQSMQWDLAWGGTSTNVGPPCTCHHQQHFYHLIPNQRLHLRENSHVCCGGAIVPHGSHSHSNFSCPVNISWVHVHPSASHFKQKQHRATEGSPTSSSKQQRQPAGELERSPLPPFPSAHGAPYVICQHCALLLHVPSPGTLLRSRSLTLKCGACLNFSTFSTRHFYGPRSLATAGITTLSSSLSPKGLFEPTSMPGYGASHVREALSAEALTCAVSESASQLNGGLEYDISRQNIKANGACKHETTERMEIATVDDIFEASLEVTWHTKASACLNDDHGPLYQVEDSKTGESLSGICADTFEDRIDDAKDDSNAESSQSQDKDVYGCVNVVNDLTADMCHNKPMEGGINKLREESFHTEMEEEITIMSSVQSWVDSLSPQMGYESDSLFQCSEKCAVGCEKHGCSPHRSPLHRHFGYKSPLELFEKVSSEDQEMRTRTETNSSASSLSSPNNAHENPNASAASMQVRASSLRGWSNGAVKSVGNSPSSGERDAQRSLPKLLMRGFTKRNHSQASLKGKVVVNGHVLSSDVVKQAEERAGKLRPGNYWYDCKAGFWGVEGGPCLGILPPLIEELSYPMAGNCSNGDTKVYINGRELHSKDLTVLSQRGLSKSAGRAYALGFDGVLVDETTGLEVKHLGKLAPTVERKGKGFGMFAADIAPQVKKQVLQDVKSNPVAL